MIRPIFDDEFEMVRNFIRYGDFPEEVENYINGFGIYNVTDSIFGAAWLFMKVFGVHGVYGSWNGNIEGIYGAVPVTDATVEIFSFVDTHVSSFKFVKYMKKFLNYLEEIESIQRIQSTVMIQNEKAFNMHLKFGFEKEGVMRKYDGKNDYYLLGKVL